MTKVVKGGKQLSFRAVVVVGDEAGTVGVGCAAAGEVVQVRCGHEVVCGCWRARQAPQRGPIGRLAGVAAACARARCNCECGRRPSRGAASLD